MATNLQRPPSPPKEDPPPRPLPRPKPEKNHPRTVPVVQTIFYCKLGSNEVLLIQT